jgi:hypothetical protein
MHIFTNMNSGYHSSAVACKMHQWNHYEWEFCKYGSNPLEPNVESNLSYNKVSEHATSRQMYVQFNVKAGDVVSNILHE